MTTSRGHLARDTFSGAGGAIRLSNNGRETRALRITPNDTLMSKTNGSFPVSEPRKPYTVNDIKTSIFPLGFGIRLRFLSQKRGHWQVQAIAFTRLTAILNPAARRQARQGRLA